MKITAEPRSDQWNADDFVGGPRTFTIAGVKPGAAEQKYDIELVEGEGRVWRPPVTMLRVLIAAWGDEAADWVGRRATLYLDPNVRFGKEATGGIRISHLSHITEPKKLALTVTRGKKATFTVQPLTEPAPAPSRDWVTEAKQFTTVDDLRAHYMDAQKGGATPKQLADIIALAPKPAPTEP